MACRVQPDRLCLHGRPCMLQMEGQQGQQKNGQQYRLSGPIVHKHYSTQGSRAITQPSTSCAQSSLTSLIGREGELSGWYGRSMLCALTQGSRAITQPSTSCAQSRLTSLIGREGELSGWYGRSMLCALFQHAIPAFTRCHSPQELPKHHSP